jgi:glutamyl-queuosine tRNA(Asp) synthetase
MTATEPADTGSPYIGRLAPSPTGLLHLGHAATFWRAFIRAREHNGTLLLRNEDLDKQRTRLHFVDAILKDLAWLGIAWQPPMMNQSERLPLYRQAFERLVSTGLVYNCSCSRKDLARLAQAPHEDADPEPIYEGRCRANIVRSADEAPAPGAAYRLRVPDGEVIHFTDLNLGPQSFIAGQDFGDFVLWSRDGIPSYQLACVVDDAATGITEVVRGRDLLKSTARQLLLQRVLNLPTPAYFHTPLLTDEHGVRLAKRHDALSLRTLRERGLTPADVIALFSA